jgi:hypothetical protein
MRGSCLCAEVVYEVDAPFDFLTHCHCSICRKHHGAAFVSWLGARPGALRLVRGSERVGRYESSAGFFRSFCAGCGGKVPTLPRPEDTAAVIPAGSLDGDPGVRPMAHIFVGSKAPWHEISDSLPRFEAYPPGVPAAEVRAAPPKAPPPGRIGGSCLCGAVAYEIEPPLDLMRNCHCSRCRKERGAAHATNALGPIGRFNFARGSELVAEYKVPEARFYTHAFCRACGSSVPRVSADRGFVIVPAGSLDGDPGIRTREHIFVGSKAPWFEITDRLPQFVEQAVPGSAPAAARR